MTVDDVTLLQTRIRRDISVNAMASIIMDEFPVKLTPRKYQPMIPSHHLSLFSVLVPLLPSYLPHLEF